MSARESTGLLSGGSWSQVGEAAAVQQWSSKGHSMGDIKDTVKNQVQEKGWGTAQRGDAGLQLTLNGF